jgi:hypothetical protein
MKYVNVIVRTTGVGLLLVGVALIVLNGFALIYVVPAAAGVLLFSLGPYLMRYLPGSAEPVARARPGGWAHKTKEAPAVPAGSGEKVIQDLEDPQAGKPQARVWLPKRDGPSWIRKLPRSRHIWRIPGFRQFKRLVAFGCMVLNFVMGELALTSPGNVVFSIFFLATSFLLADYLWKTRRKPGEMSE